LKKKGAKSLLLLDSNRKKINVFEGSLIPGMRLSFQIGVFKNPITDPTKASKHGNLTLIRTQSGEYRSVRREELEDGWEDQVTLIKNQSNFDPIKL
jgi:hypothetical protein